MNDKRFRARLAVVGVALLAASAAGEDWPTYQHDIARSGVTAEQLALPLHETWAYHSMHAPAPAWPPPAKQDFWHQLRQLQPRVTFDRAFHVVAVEDTAYFGSSADDKVYALDAETGRVRWTFFTEGPVRLAPTVANGKVYVGSDDGRVYCLNAEDGRLLWRRQIAPQDRRIPGNGRMMSLFPVRTGVLVDRNVAYCFAGLFPGQGVYRCALDGDDGAVIWHEQTEEVSPQGYLLASAERLYAPTGRTSPAAFLRVTGELAGRFEGNGGAYALLVDEALVSADTRQGAGLRLSNASTTEQITSFDGLRMVVDRGRAYLHTRTKISAFDRTRYMELAGELHEIEKQKRALEEQAKKATSGGQADKQSVIEAELGKLDRAASALRGSMRECFLWEMPYRYPYALILAGDTLFAGGDGEVVAIDAGDGSEVWIGEVRGKAYGLSVANGRLFASTDEGVIHCFTPREAERAQVIKVWPEGEPYPPDQFSPVYADAAEQIVSMMWPDPEAPKKGYCLVLGAGEGRLAYELARRTELRVVCIEEDAANVAKARESLDRAGLYGTQVAVHHGALAELPYGSLFANLVVSDRTVATGELPPSIDEVHRVLRPYGGMAYIGAPKSARKLGKTVSAAELRRWLQGSGLDDWEVRKGDGAWAIVRHAELPGSGEWTQLYADAGHTACSNDEVRGPVSVQWFGEPGPRRIIDRHHRPMASLVKEGRVFVPADDSVIALDAFNGTQLWDLEVPNSRRVGAMKNCGHMLLADGLLYIAVEDQCWAVDTVTGTRRHVLKAPELMSTPSDWGYLNWMEDRLYGTGQKAGASLTKLSKDTVNFLEGDFRPVVVSEFLFSVDRTTGEVLWTYRGGAIMNSAIAMGGGRIYFVESRNAEAMADNDGRMRIDEFCRSDTYAVALDAKTGEKCWERGFDFPHHHIMFTCYSNETMLVTGSYNKGDGVYYGLNAFDAGTGEPRWENRFVATNIRGTEPSGQGGSHGEQWQHPVIIRGSVYLRPYRFALQTGERGDYHLYRGGHGCGGLTGSSYYLYGRGSNPRMYPVEVDSTEGIRITQATRPGCWLNIIPAGGLILIPESSSGCTCAYPMQTSLAFVPRSMSGARF